VRHIFKFEHVPSACLTGKNYVYFTVSCHSHEKRQWNIVCRELLRGASIIHYGPNDCSMVG
jgi:hypothetical protein